MKREAKLGMSATVTELRESSGEDGAEFVKCVHESNVAGNMHKRQYGQSMHKEQKPLTQNTDSCFRPS